LASDLKLLQLKYADGLSRLPPQTTNSLIVMSGLPGTGKSHLAQDISVKFGYLVVGSDTVRKTLVKEPKYNSDEHFRVFRACHAYLKDALSRQIGVIFDATNLNAHAINPLKKIARMCDVDCKIIRCIAPESVIKSRLTMRSEGKDDFESDADWRIYQMLKPNQRVIQDCDYIVDSSQDVGWIIEKLANDLRWV